MHYPAQIIQLAPFPPPLFPNQLPLLLFPIFIPFSDEFPLLSLLGPGYSQLVLGQLWIWQRTEGSAKNVCLGRRLTFFFFLQVGFLHITHLGAYSSLTVKKVHWSKNLPVTMLNFGCLVHLGCFNKNTTDWVVYKQQKLISHNSGGWEVREQRASR